MFVNVRPLHQDSVPVMARAQDFTPPQSAFPALVPRSAQQSLRSLAVTTRSESQLVTCLRQLHLSWLAPHSD